MSPASNLLLALGLAMLAHAAYSAHEHTTLTALLVASSSGSSGPASVATASALPTDITLETLASVLLLCTGLVLGAEPLRPIRWRAWAGSVDHGALKQAYATVGKEKGEVKPGFEWVEKRKSFLDVRGERTEFANWVRAKEGKGK